MNARTPFNLVSGFLGSGKTRLINRLLAHRALTDTAVIVNELGEEGIDQLLYEAQPESVVLLANGCLCCAARSDLPGALERLERRRRALGRPPFARVVLETSGLADPGPVLASLLSDPELARAYRVDSVIVTASVLHLDGQLARFPEAARQLALADRVVLTWADAAAPERSRACRALLRQRFPRARVCTRAQAEARPARLLGAGLHDPLRGRPRPLRWLGPDLPGETAEHGAGVQSFVLRLAVRPAWGVLQQWLGTLLALQGERILRVKGVAWLSDHPGPVAVHAVHHQLQAPVDLSAAHELPAQSLFVFVTDGLSRGEVQASLAGWGLAEADATAGDIAKQIHRIA